MSQLVIIGAGLMGREVATWAHETGFFVKGFLDSRQGILDGFKGYPPIIGTVEDYNPAREDEFVCALGEPAQKEIYLTKINCGGGGAFRNNCSSAVLCRTKCNNRGWMYNRSTCNID